MSKFWFFVLGGLACFAAASLFAEFNIVVVTDKYSGGEGSSTAEIRGWAPDVTNAGASAGFATGLR